MSKFRIHALLGGVAVVVAGCAEPQPDMKRVQLAEDQLPVLLSSGVRPNNTPVTPALRCYGKELKKAGKGGIGIAVGDIRDYTGKQNDSEGTEITQGGALMAYSALGEMQPGISLYERFDTRIADAELNYISQRQLGDGGTHEVDDPKTGEKNEVKWKPYFGGSVQQSDYFIVGGITELNYNIQSGGGEASVNNVGPLGRTFTMNVAVDLRIVGTQSLRVYDTVSVQKQISGYEVGFDIFRFFGSDLYDLNLGAKSQEPLQLGVRMAIETAVLDLVQTVTDLPFESCANQPPLVPADTLLNKL